MIKRQLCGHFMTYTLRICGDTNISRCIRLDVTGESLFYTCCHRSSRAMSLQHISILLSFVHLCTRMRKSSTMKSYRLAQKISILAWHTFRFGPLIANGIDLRIADNSWILLLSHYCSDWRRYYYLSLTRPASRVEPANSRYLVVFPFSLWIQYSTSVHIMYICYRKVFSRIFRYTIN